MPGEVAHMDAPIMQEVDDVTHVPKQLPVEVNEDLPEFTPEQIHNIIRITVDACVEKFELGLDAPDFAWTLFDRIPSQQHDGDEVVASRSQMRVVIRSTMECAVHAQSCEKDHVHLTGTQQATITEIVLDKQCRDRGRNSQKCQVVASSSTRSTLRQEPGFGRGPHRTAKKKR